MRQILMRTIALAFLAIALTLSAPLVTEQAAVFAQGTGQMHHPSGQRGRGQVVRRKVVRKGAIGAGGAGLYNVKAKRRGSTLKVKPIKKKSVIDDTDIVQ